MRRKHIGLLLACFYMCAFLQAQVPDEHLQKRNDVGAQEAARRNSDREAGISRTDREYIDNQQQSNPRYTVNDFINERNKAAAEAKEAAKAKARGASFLSTPEALGYAYAEAGKASNRTVDFANDEDYVCFVLVLGSYPVAEPLKRVYFSGRNPSVYQGGPRGNQISIDASYDLSSLDLKAFFRINRQLLRDFPEFIPHRNSYSDLNSFNAIGLTPNPVVHAASPKSPSYTLPENVRSQQPSSANFVMGRLYENLLALDPIETSSTPTSKTATSSRTNVMAVTFAPTSYEKTIVTLFNLQESMAAGGLRGRMYIVDNRSKDLASLLDKELLQDPYLKTVPHAPASNTPSKSKVGADSPRHKRTRIFCYGESQLISSISDMSEARNSEIIRRTNGELKLTALNDRLDVISMQRISSTQLTIVNGLPDSAEKVAAMGHFAGNPELWLKYREEVSSIIASTQYSELTTVEGLRDELINGNNDVLFLFAHSDGGISIHIGGEKLTLKDLEKLPNRNALKRKPRFAVLFSCETGLPPRTVGSIFGLREASQVNRLAQLLTTKGYFDRVLAPTHSFKPEEGKNVLGRVLQSGGAILNIHRWVNWAIERFIRTNEEG